MSTMMKLAFAVVFIQSALGFQLLASQPRSATSLTAYRYSPLMVEDGDSLYDDDYSRQKRLRQWNGGVGNAYYNDYYNGSYDTGLFGLRTLAPDQAGDSRRNSRLWNSWGGYRNMFNNFGGYSGYNSYMPSYERMSYAYSAPTAAGVRPYTGHGRNLYIDNNRYGRGRGLYSQGGVLRTPYSRSYNSRYGRGFRRPEGIPIRGGDQETFTVQPNVRRVRLVLQTDGMPLYARVQLLSGIGYNNIKNIGNVFRDIDQGPFEAIIDTPEIDSKIRIFNTGGYEYTIYAWLEPYEFGGPMRGRYRNRFVSPYQSYQSLSRFDHNGRLRM
eukprot:scaffold8902_cov131-Amphora_coffeaeformis.AAC.4